ncbi:aldo/keto reductase [Paenalkalicoccus suaedae]|uniref:Aldo/keto reductase n=1 Tax=Paenalkalicoccus suaedae TaxID=2592382 RepID=A0A859FD09_9BACI|nr:aldo/keto reductase [Paenalkalicoccus suaedae]QKS70810.1 aldo/keto reductase [Paenalkalicoccus suaedae]
MTQLRPLGKSDIKLSPLGLGCWQFSKGNNPIGKYWSTLEDEDMKAIIQTSLDGGINWFDTAEIYGKGESERTLASTLDKLDVPFEDALIATKWWPLMRKAESITQTIHARMDALNQRPISLYQVHQPFSLSSVQRQMEEMASLIDKGLIQSVGVSNFSAKAMREAHAVLESYGIPLVSNQVKYSLLDRSIEKNGVLDAAKELGISIIAYSPLEQGLLTGKYHDDQELFKSLSGPRKYMGKYKGKQLEKTRSLIELMRDLASKYNVTISQVALNWMIHYHGETVFVIPGASKVKHAKENVGAMSFKLSDTELLQLSDEAWRVGK